MKHPKGNPVAKNMNQTTRPATFKDRKKYSRPGEKDKLRKERTFYQPNHPSNIPMIENDDWYEEG
jgi:hypothetical protein|tara:strand:- start:3481 stop:3675 length:195 start_codon:yes stop_codon:yes gene_type:complete